LNTVDILLSLDRGSLKRPVKEYSVRSLSVAAKQTVSFKYKGLDSEQFNYIQDNSISYDKKGRVVNIDKTLMAKFGVIEGVVEPNLKDKNLRDHYKCATVLELLDVLMLPGEILDLFDKISNETGLGDNKDAIEEVKNS